MNVSTLTDSELLATARACLSRHRAEEADLLVLLGEMDARRLYGERAFSSMFAFCVEELGFSEDAACNRIAVARLARAFPRVLDFVREGRIHLTGVRLLAPILTAQNLEEVLGKASGKSRRQIEELLAELAPQPSVPASIRKWPAPAPRAVAVPDSPEPEDAPLPLLVSAAAPPPMSVATAPPPRPPAVKPLSVEAYRVEFTASRRLKAKLEQAEELLRHRVPKGDLAAVVERALDVLIEQVKKERFGVGRIARRPATAARPPEPAEPAQPERPPSPATRHIPVAIRREVYERDGGQCTFTSAEGRRCAERGGLEIDHLDGFARIAEHRAERLTLRCSAHNQLAADRMYGQAFMQAKRRGGRSIRPGTDNSTRPAPLAVRSVETEGGAAWPDTG